MVGTYIQKGNVCEFENNTGSDIVRNQLVIMEDKIGIAVDDILENQTGIVNLKGVFVFNKDNSEIKIGQLVYYDESNDVITTSSSGNKLVGFAFGNSGQNDTVVEVSIG